MSRTGLKHQPETRRRTIHFLGSAFQGSQSPTLSSLRQHCSFGLPRRSERGWNFADKDALRTSTSLFDSSCQDCDQPSTLFSHEQTDASSGKWTALKTRFQESLPWSYRLLRRNSLIGRSGVSESHVETDSNLGWERDLLRVFWRAGYGLEIQTHHKESKCEKTVCLSSLLFRLMSL